MTEQTTTDERAEHLLHPRSVADQLRAIFAGGERADDGLIAALAREVLAERDGLRQRIASARSEIVRQSVLVHGGPTTFVQDALAEVESHLVDPEFRPEAAKGGAS